MPTPISPEAYVRWFRDSSPYIHAHRGKTFVVSFGGEAVADSGFPNTIHDFAMLNSLGVRLVLVHGIRPQVDARLKSRGVEAHYHQGLRITDNTALECVKEAAGTVRVEIEALLSQGLANSPMAGARIRVASGNFVTAKPVGVRDGVDFQHTGEVRRIDVDGIRGELDRGDIVLLSAIGYSPTGEVFNLSAEQVATSAAIALKADKLLLLTEQDCLSGFDGQLIRQLTTGEAEVLLKNDNSLADSEVAPHLKAAVEACCHGVRRAHLLDRHIDGAVLLELFTRDGVGTLVSKTAFETMRPATVQDVSGVLDLIAPLEQNGVLVPRSRERLETDIEDFIVIERDGLIIGCAALHVFKEERMGELACLALHNDYRGEKRGERLLEHLEAKARVLHIERLFVLTTQTAHWFRERGFEPARTTDLPEARRASYNSHRASKVLIKPLKPSLA
ncbi:amino-acid N-acetyltransferase [Methylocaldum sp.]|uniref:amino-acid N-acetyltransferase n=1 Tax=Methylocaldum sp. TaxID=1969727 RepID=UPI002D2F42F9|nr:amino-acid N-acetyltransferase [Methylocaldum sp.]HYE36842.1 amino-acid N-acetyltransferase [Methylocaldum sp.]